ncbi:MBL fold metallo-hydrolase [Jiangella ureilytica]|uniref:MBL fold metallo-hydrolase n=1 Tax=Jiangella ureilytica TaxID=2530374 RepID=A0A4R4RZD3_9ACTN|nr:MBL fold metallo-hydrolase [Jiangella ureilytica]TDC54372.1 MBL fold metallo-hydrolase [Jiangella ureilytica]
MLTDPPAEDEFEVSIFGPGKGESIVVHLGQNEWIIVDSCIDQVDGSNPALRYLEQLGVDSSSVLLVVATHAHDDHFAGIAEVFRVCERSSFVCSPAVVSEEFYALTEIDEELERLMRASALSEYRKVIQHVEDRGRSAIGLKSMVRASNGKTLVKRRQSDLPMTVTALSPSDEAVTRALKSLARGAASIGERLRLPAHDPNELAIALWVEVGECAALLGADLLKGPAGCGWGAVLAEFTPDFPASLHKVPHHGSPNAHHDEVWATLLEGAPVALLAPYRGGRTYRPAQADRERICGLTDKAFVTASPDLPKPRRAVKTTAAALGPLAMRVHEPWGRSGQIRARRSPDDRAWRIDLSETARPLCSP